MHRLNQIFAGEITSAKQKRTYDIQFDDGERSAMSDQHIDRGRLCPAFEICQEGRNNSAPVIRLSEGETIEAKCAGWTRYYRGKVRASIATTPMTSSLTMVSEERAWRYIGYAVSTTDLPSVAIEEDRREGQGKMQGWTKYFDGEITHKNSDGTYDIRLTMGSVSAAADSQIQDLGLPPTVPPPSGAIEQSSSAAGDRVIACCDGWTQWFR